MRAAKADANQAEIVAALRKIGANVESLHRVGGGVPDLLVGYRGRNYLLEVKGPKHNLNKTQRAWFAYWDGQRAVVRTEEEAVLVVVNNEI